MKNFSNYELRWDPPLRDFWRHFEKLVNEYSPWDSIFDKWWLTFRHIRRPHLYFLCSPTNKSSWKSLRKIGDGWVEYDNGNVFLTNMWVRSIPPPAFTPLQQIEFWWVRCCIEPVSLWKGIIFLHPCFDSCFCALLEMLPHENITWPLQTRLFANDRDSLVITVIMLFTPSEMSSSSKNCSPQVL